MNLEHIVINIVGHFGTMVDYSKGKIYKMFNTFNDDIYVGSTAETLHKRFTRHKSIYKREQNRHTRIYQAIKDIGFDNFYIELIEEYSCKTRIE